MISYTLECMIHSRVYDIIHSRVYDTLIIHSRVYDECIIHSRVYDECIIHSRVYDIIHSRSEEHTSELQSQFHLVCRLLLEKKKKNKVGLMLIQILKVTNFK